MIVRDFDVFHYFFEFFLPPDKNITAKLDVLMPQSLLLDVDTKFRLTIPSGKNPMTVHLKVKEKAMNEYDVSIVLTYNSTNLNFQKYLRTIIITRFIIITNTNNN